jgi:hypothetical protein
MNNSKNLYKLIDGLNNKINTLEINIANNFKDEKKIINSKIDSYRIHLPIDVSNDKKYIGLTFDNNLNNFEPSTDENSGNKNLLSFIKLPKSNIIINYFIQLELNYTPLTSSICSLALGVRVNLDSKIKIIKGSRHFFDISNSSIISGNINLNNTSIYMSGDEDELCMIAELGNICKINSKKSLIKLLYI